MYSEHLESLTWFLNSSLLIRHPNIFPEFHNLGSRKNTSSVWIGPTILSW